MKSWRWHAWQISSSPTAIQKSSPFRTMVDVMVPFLLRFVVLMGVEVPVICLCFYLGRYAPGGVYGLFNMYPIMKGFFFLISVGNPLWVSMMHYSPAMLKWFIHLITLRPINNAVYYNCSSSSRWPCAANDIDKTIACCGKEQFTNCTNHMSYPLFQYYGDYFNDMFDRGRPPLPYLTLYSLYSFAVTLLVGLVRPPLACLTCGIFLILTWAVMIAALIEYIPNYYDLHEAFSYFLFRRRPFWDAIKVVMPLIKSSWLVTSACFPVYFYLGRRADPTLHIYRVAFSIASHRLVYSLVRILRRATLSTSLSVIYNVDLTCLLVPLPDFDEIFTRVPQVMQHTLRFGSHERIVRLLIYTFHVCSWFEVVKAIQIYIFVEDILVRNTLLASLHLKWVVLVVTMFTYHCLHTFIFNHMPWRARRLFRNLIDYGLCMQYLLLLVIVFWGFGTERVIATIHYIRKMELSDEFLNILKWSPAFSSAIFFSMTLYYEDSFKAVDYYNEYDRYKLIFTLVPLAVIVYIMISSFCMMVVYFFKNKTLQDLLNPTKGWGPVTAKERRYRLYFNPGRYNYAYNPFYIPDHRCLLGHEGILKRSKATNKLLRNVPEEILRVRRETARVDLRHRLSRLIKEANHDLW